MGINKLWLKGEKFARSIERKIDDQTLLDLLAIVVYESERMGLLEDAGFQDQASSIECLFDYVLDALEIPPEGGCFKRESFEELFYNDYLLEKRFDSLDQVLLALKELRDAINLRAKKAQILRAEFRVAKPTE